MVKKEEAQAISYKESKKVAKFYNKLDKAIKRAAHKGYTLVNVPSCGFDEAELLYLLKPYYDDENYNLIRKLKKIYNEYYKEKKCFAGFCLEWTKPPIIKKWESAKN